MSRHAEYEAIQLEPFELGWLVGILEGEGTFMYIGKTTKVAIRMADEDTINKVAALYEKVLRAKVRVYEQAPAQAHHAIMYVIDLTGPRARMIMRMIVRHMSIRRRQRIWQVLNEYKAPPPVKLDLVKLGIIKAVK